MDTGQQGGEIVSALIEDFEAELLDDGISEDVFGDALDLLSGLFTAEAVEFEHKEFALANIVDFGIAERGKRAMDRLSLGIEDCGLQHDPDVSFH